MGVPQNRWFIREHPIKVDDLGVPPFMETPCNKWEPDIWHMVFHGISIAMCHGSWYIMGKKNRNQRMSGHPMFKQSHKIDHTRWCPHSFVCWFINHCKYRFITPIHQPQCYVGLINQLNAFTTWGTTLQQPPSGVFEHILEEASSILQKLFINLRGASLLFKGRP